LIFDVPLQQLVVKMAIAAAVWIAVAEIPAWLTASLREARTEMERLAATDPLTGLANRRYWDEQLPQLLERNPFSVVLLIDLDHFKAFNDTHGHLAGDEMLIAFAQSIRRAMPAGDIASRWGGEEFALAVRDGVQARIVADEIRNNVPLGQTCSIGLAEHRPGEPVLELLRRADEALYAAKDGGRDRIVAA
jgi:diguanylate cyclase (GGDEF)-like protein